MPTFRPRPAGPDDADVLAAMIVEAVNWRPDRPRRTADEVFADPVIARYVAGWGRGGDMGVVAEDFAGLPIGACWLRFFAATAPGYGFLDSTVPEISLAVVAGWRGRGVGRALLRELATTARQSSIQRLSLSVETGNRAIELYRSEGFLVVSTVGDATIMTKELTDSPSSGAA